MSESLYEILAEHLRKLPSLESLSDEEVRNFASKAELKQYPRGEIILYQGEPSREFFIIITGQVSAVGT